MGLYQALGLLSDMETEFMSHTGKKFKVLDLVKKTVTKLPMDCYH